MNLKRLFLYLLIASVALSAMIGIGVILLGNFGPTEQKILATTVTITITSIFGLACGAYIETGRGKALPYSGIFFAVLAAVLWLIVIWYQGEPNERFMKSVVTDTLLAVACSHVSLLSLARFDRRFEWARPAAYLLVTALTGFSIFIIWFEPKEDNQLIGRIVGVLAILVASITVVTPVFHKLSAVESNIAEIDEEIAALKAKIDDLEAKKAGLTSANGE